MRGVTGDAERGDSGAEPRTRGPLEKGFGRRRPAKWRSPCNFCEDLTAEVERAVNLELGSQLEWTPGRWRVTLSSWTPAAWPGSGRCGATPSETGSGSSTLPGR